LLNVIFLLISLFHTRILGCLCNSRYISSTHILTWYSTGSSSRLFPFLQSTLPTINDVIDVILSHPKHIHQVIGFLQLCLNLLLSAALFLFVEFLLLALELHLLLHYDHALFLFLLPLSLSDHLLLLNDSLIFCLFVPLPLLSLPQELGLDASSFLL